MRQPFELGPQRGAFRASSGIVWRLSGVVALLLVPMVLKRVVWMDPWSGWAAAAAFASLGLVPILFFALLGPLFWLYRIRVHELGLRGYDAYGRFRSVRWPQMTAASSLHLLTLPYVRVRTSEPGVELVLPLFLADRPGFERLLASCAGPENPLVRHLASKGA